MGNANKLTHKKQRFLEPSFFYRYPMEMEAAYLRFQAAHPWRWHLFSLLSHHSPTHPPPNHVTWEQTQAEHLFSADLPGVRKEEIRVEVEDARYLVIRTELNDDDDDANGTDGGGRRRFTRKFRLPGMVDVDGISAEYAHGVLTVTVPRMHTRATPRAIGAGPARDSAARAA